MSDENTNNDINWGEFPGSPKDFEDAKEKYGNLRSENAKLAEQLKEAQSKSADIDFSDFGQIKEKFADLEEQYHEQKDKEWVDKTAAQLGGQDKLDEALAKADELGFGELVLSGEATPKQLEIMSKMHEHFKALKEKNEAEGKQQTANNLPNENKGVSTMNNNTGIPEDADPNLIVQNGEKTIYVEPTQKGLDKAWAERTLDANGRAVPLINHSPELQAAVVEAKRQMQAKGIVQKIENGFYTINQPKITGKRGKPELRAKGA